MARQGKVRDGVEVYRRRVVSVLLNTGTSGLRRFADQGPLLSPVTEAEEEEDEEEEGGGGEDEEEKERRNFAKIYH